MRRTHIVLTASALSIFLAGCGGGKTETGALNSGSQTVLPEVAFSDIMSFPGRYADYTITVDAAGTTVKENAGISVAVPPNIKRLRFADATVALDTTGVPGQVYRLYQAAFDRRPDSTGLGYQIDQMERVGHALETLAQNFINSPEFSSRYGNLNNVQFVTQLYANVLHRAPDDAGLAFHVGHLNAGTRTRAQILMGFSESPENMQLVAVAIANGIPYVRLGEPPVDFGSGAPGPSPNPDPIPGPFSASVVRAPIDGETITGPMRIEIQGTGIGNAELLPSEGYVPRLGVFTVSQDRTYAYLDLDTTTVPNGTLSLRISAFDLAAGTPGAREIIAMRTRTWVFRNLPPPFGSAAGRAARCVQMGRSYTSMDDSQPVVCIRWTPPSPPIPQDQCRGGFDTLYGNPEDGLPVLRNGQVISKLYCEPRALNGVLNPGCICIS